MLGNGKVVLLVLVSLPCFGQKIEVGVKGGVPLMNAFETGSFFTMNFGEGASSATRRYTVGPMVELRLPHGFELEFNVLYSRLGFADLTKSVGLIFDYANTSANSWSFPVLAKYRLPAFRVVRLYIEVGPSFRTVSGVSVSTTRIIECCGGITSGPTHSSSDSHLNSRSNAGVAAGLGMQVRLAFLHISPEVRYTHWKADQQPDPYLYANQHQVELLLGITF
jgi:hypothetical protein